jgi:hypothetical protein
LLRQGGRFRRRYYPLALQWSFAIQDHQLAGTLV